MPFGQISLLDLLPESFQAWSHGADYGGSELRLAESWNTKHLGFRVETIDPGKFSCPYHLHTGEEELFIGLKGACVVRVDGDFKRVKAGELVYFPTGVLHHFYNPGPEPFVFFALSNRNPADSCEYPDSRKKMSFQPRKILQDGVEVEDYWLGEEDPRSFWPKEWLDMK